MANVNMTEVYLLNTPLEHDYKNTLYFTNIDSQISYFKSKKVKQYTDFSYQRKDNVIRVPDHIDTLWNCNYVMYQNKAYNNKWFYCFIIDMKYINDGCTEVQIETDVIQTWLFDYELKASFVEREHVSDDTIGANTVPEGLELGEYKINRHTKADQLYNDLKLVVGSTIVPSDLIAEYGASYNGIYSGVKYYSYDVTNMNLNLQAIVDRYEASAITSLFYAPSFLVNATGGVVSESSDPASFDYNFLKVSVIDGYTPRNKKLLTYPYTYILASNGQGANAIYHQELFTLDDNGQCRFKVYGCLTPGCSIRLVPQYYNGTKSNVDEGINLGKYPQCNWATDMYTNWLTQNGVSIATSLVGEAIQTVGGVAMMTTPGTALAGAAGVASGVSGVANTLNEVHKAQMIPPQTYGNINCGDVTTSMKENTFHLYAMSIKKEFAEIIDGYFDMFGYKVNKVKLPNKAHRSRWWFTKTIDVNIDGAIPNKDMDKIKECYNTGITFWRNPDEIQNYSLSNDIV